ncbi:MAG: HD domain-containing protein [Candidatus Magasanikbacteria bacterium]|nr:HD domain-containing protein [Candidatus Magasanikbacteria bacterium]
MGSKYPKYSDVDREGFLAIVRVHVKNTAHVALIEFAYDIAHESHHGQTRHCGRHYIDHPVEVAIMAMKELGISRWDIIVLALLHDVLEDDLKFSRHAEIVQWFGSDMLVSMELLSKKTGKNVYSEIRARGTLRDYVVKLLDALHNLRTLHACPPDKQKAILRRAKDIYMPYTWMLGARFGDEGRAYCAYLAKEFGVFTENRVK